MWSALQRCADGDLQAVLLDGFDGTQLWTRDLGVDQAQLVGADRVVDVVVGDALQVLSPADGSTLSTLALPAATDDRPPQQAGVEGAALVWLRGTAYVLDAASGAVRWSVPALGLPSTGTGKGEPASVVVPEDGAFVTRDLVTGAETARSTTTGPVPRRWPRLRGGLLRRGGLGGRRRCLRLRNRGHWVPCFLAAPNPALRVISGS